MIKKTFGVLLCLTLLINLWLIAARFLLGQDLPKFFGYSQAVVLSGSMEPTFSAGDMLIFRQQDSYKTDDIVIFRQGGTFVTHRIVGKNDQGFITRGDANNTEDSEPLAPEYIEGRLRLIIPGLGGILTFLRTPLGLLLIIAIGVLLIEVPHVIDINKGKRVKRDE